MGDWIIFPIFAVFAFVWGQFERWRLRETRKDLVELRHACKHYKAEGEKAFEEAKEIMAMTVAESRRLAFGLPVKAEPPKPN